MASINLDLDYFTHPKTQRLIGLLGRGAEVLPLRLWCYCGKHHSENGRLAAIAAQEIEAAVFWWGKKGDAVKGLIKSGFLEMDGETFVVHDWLDHSGHIRVYRERALAGAKARWEKARIRKEAVLVDASSNASSIASSNASLSNGLKEEIPSEEEKKRHSSEGGPGEGKSAFLAREFAFHSRHRSGKEKDAVGLTPSFAELLRLGATYDAILAEIHRPGRNRNEWFSEFEKRMRPPDKKNGALVPTPALVREMREKRRQAQGAK